MYYDCNNLLYWMSDHDLHAITIKIKEKNSSVSFYITYNIYIYIYNYNTLDKAFERN